MVLSRFSDDSFNDAMNNKKVSEAKANIKIDITVKKQITPIRVFGSNLTPCLITFRNVLSGLKNLLKKKINNNTKATKIN